MFKPHARVTTQVGYSINSVNGQTPQFNALQPPGSLQYNYYQPLANVASTLATTSPQRPHGITISTGKDPSWDLPVPVISTRTMRHFPCAGHSEREECTSLFAILHVKAPFLSLLKAIPPMSAFRYPAAGMLQPLRQQARRELLAEGRKHAITRKLDRRACDVRDASDRLKSLEGKEFFRSDRSVAPSKSIPLRGD